MIIRSLIFLELLALFICAIGHLVTFVIGIDFPHELYWVLPLIVFGAGILTIIVVPIAEWFIK